MWSVSHISQQNPERSWVHRDGTALLKVFSPIILGTDKWQWDRAGDELPCNKEAALGWSRVGWGDRTQSCTPATAIHPRLHSSTGHR